MVNHPENLKKYTSLSEDELTAKMRKYPFYTLPKIALLIKRGIEDKSLLAHVALTAYDRGILEKHIAARADFL